MKSSFLAALLLAQPLGFSVSRHLLNASGVLAL